MLERSTSTPSAGGLRSAIKDPYARALALLTFAVYLLTLSWALAMPHFDGPDEIRHYNSVARLVDGGGWPMPYEAKLLPSVRTALDESDLYRATLHGDAEPDLPLPSERSTLLGEADAAAGWRDYMVQHPPAYYALIAAAYSVIDGDGLRWDIALLVMRAFSAVLFAAAVPFVAGSVRAMTGSRTAALVGTSALVSIPFATNAGAYLTNDSLLTLTICAATYFLLRFTSSPGASRWWQVAAGAAVGLALLTKGFALMFLPAVLVLGLLAAHRRREWRSWTSLASIFLPLVIGTAVGGWWWVRNLILLGVVQPSQFGNRERTGVASETYEGVWAFAVSAWQRLAATFWGRGVNPDIAFAGWATSAASVAALAMLVAAIVLGRRRLDLLALASYPALIAGMTLVNAYGIYFDIGDPDRGVQGRYLFSGLTVLAIAVGVVFLAVRRTWRRPPGLVVPVALMAPWVSALLGQALMRQRTWETREETLEAAGATVAEWMVVSPHVATALAVAAAALIVALAIRSPALARVGKESDEGEFTRVREQRGRPSTIRRAS